MEKLRLRRRFGKKTLKGRELENLRGILALGLFWKNIEKEVSLDA